MSGGSRLNMGVAIRILAALLLGCFMLPSFDVSGGAHSAEITGIALLTGAETGAGNGCRRTWGCCFFSIYRCVCLLFGVFIRGNGRERQHCYPYFFLPQD